MNKKSLFYSAIPIFLLSSCSIKYDVFKNAEEEVPEFVFENTKLIRYENNEPVLELSAQTLEQYKNKSEIYGKKTGFKSFEDGEVDNQGSCDYFFTDTDKELYKLAGNIEFQNKSENMTFYANKLMWDSKTEQLTGTKNDYVRIQKDDAIITGKGFSSSGISKSFEFSGEVSGQIGKDKDSEEQLTEDEAETKLSGGAE